MSGRLFVVSAPSGAGKTSLVQSLVQGDDSLMLSVSHTTRPKRAAETDGTHYHFVGASTFAAMREAGEFLECASVYGHCYGTSRRLTLAAVAAGRDVILEIDWQGAAQVRACWRDPVSIFVLPPSRHALRQRLTNRGQGWTGSDLYENRRGLGGSVALSRIRSLGRQRRLQRSTAYLAPDRRSDATWRVVAGAGSFGVVARTVVHALAALYARY